VPKSEKTQPGSAGPTRGVTHDKRRRAVLKCASDTARNAAITTSQVMRRLDVAGLSIEGEEAPPPAPPPQQPELSEAPAPGRGQARPPPLARGAGFDPYNKKTVRSPPPRKPAAAAAPRARAPWWRRLFQRR